MINEAEFVKRIEAIGGHAYLVGGYVRDMLIGRPSHDKDYVVCGLTAEDIISTFEAERVGRSFPVFVIDIDGVSCEVSLARTEEKTSPGYRGFKVSFDPSTTIEEDLYRRDTTMNSMALSLPDMKLIDPYNGSDDIRNKIIRATSCHFREDPVRSLRAARMSAQLGFKIEERTLKLISATKEELLKEPEERIFSEMKKALESPYPQKFFTAMRDTGLLDIIYESEHTADDAFLRSIEALNRAAKITESPISRFAAFILTLYGHCGENDVQLKVQLPNTWKKLLSFMRQELTVVLQADTAYKVLCVLEKIHRLSLNVFEVSSVMEAMLYTVPDFLQKHEEWERTIASIRSEITIPSSIPPQRRRVWLNHSIAGKLPNP